jgi:hypothetical protein
MGAALVTVSLPLDQQEQEEVVGIIEEYKELEGANRPFYIISLFTIAIFGIGSLVATVSVVATVVTVQFDLWQLGIFIAILYPTIDSWTGRNFGYNLSSVGGAVATGLMMIVTRLYEVPTSIPQNAARDLQMQFMYANR